MVGLILRWHPLMKIVYWWSIWWKINFNCTWRVCWRLSPCVIWLNIKFFDVTSIFHFFHRINRKQFKTILHSRKWQWRSWPTIVWCNNNIRSYQLLFTWQQDWRRWIWTSVQGKFYILLGNLNYNYNIIVT